MVPRKSSPLLKATVLTFSVIAATLGDSRLALAAEPRHDEALASLLRRDSLSRAELLRLVLERHPTIEATGHALRAAQARIPQATALDDPRLTYSFAPLSITGPVRYGQVIEVSQMLPFPGKRSLRGEIATAQSETAKVELALARLRLGLMASTLFDDLFVVQRALAINAEHVVLLQQLKRSAEAQYVVGRASQQDPLQAEVELSHILHDKVVLESERDRVRAQLNGLLHRLPQDPLPPAPGELTVPTSLPKPSEELQVEALRQRPELAELRARRGGADATVRLARRNYFPDLTVAASYNSMWTDIPHQFMVGVSVNLPLQLATRNAALDQAEEELQGLRSEEERLIHQIAVEVDLARTRVVEAHHLLDLYRARLVPAAKDQVLAARAGYEAAKNSFTTLVEAQKNLRSLELRAQMAVADVQRRGAELDLAVGQSPGLSPSETSR